MREPEHTAAVALHVFGIAGAVFLLLTVILVSTSTGSCQQMAVSALLTYDVYKTYFNQDASGATILFVSRVCMVLHGVFMALLAAGMPWLGVSSTWLFGFTGIYAAASGIAQILFFIFLVLFIVSLISGAVGRRSP